MVYLYFSAECSCCIKCQKMQLYLQISGQLSGFLKVQHGLSCTLNTRFTYSKTNKLEIAKFCEGDISTKKAQGFDHNLHQASQEIWPSN